MSILQADGIGINDWGAVYRCFFDPHDHYSEKQKFFL
jgi:hypothetical protein